MNVYCIFECNVSQHDGVLCVCEGRCASSTCYYLKAARDGLWFRHVTFSSPPAFISVYYKTDFSTSINWYINIISVNEITVFNFKFQLKL